MLTRESYLYTLEIFKTIYCVSQRPIAMAVFRRIHVHSFSVRGRIAVVTDARTLQQCSHTILTQ